MLFQIELRSHLLLRQALAAGDLAEPVVRFGELIDTGSSWSGNSHLDMMTLVTPAKNIDQLITALLCELDEFGMRNDTLVVWITEFGRTPFSNTADVKRS